MLHCAAMFEAIFWDNDGVLADTESLYYRATREVLATVGVALSEDAYVELFLREGKGAWHLAEARGLSAGRVQALKRQRNDLYSALIDAGPALFPGVVDIVQRLSGRYRMAIVTSSETEAFDRIHRRTGLLPHFELVVTRGDYRASKPHPEPYLCALERSRLAPEQCLVVEDSERGLRAAKAAGLTCWVIPSDLTRRCEFAGADRVLASAGDLAAALLPTASHCR